MGLIGGFCSSCILSESNVIVSAKRFSEAEAFEPNA
jgi:hypothetical protein